jgi:hypothetical protein
MQKLVLFLMATCLWMPVHARAEHMPPSCIGKAAKEFSLHPKLLHALYLTEGGQLGKKVRNKNGSYDMGPFQINTLWLKTLAPYGIDQNRITNDPLMNARTAAWRLRSEINGARGNIWKGVGNYRSRTPKYHIEQVQRVYKNYMKLTDFNENNYFSGSC